MKIAIASDHAGFKIKEAIAVFLKSENLQFTDFGTASEDSVDYPDFAKQVAKSVSGNGADMGILVCGSGIGMAMAANRFKGVRAVVVNDEFDAKMSKKHNNANVACFGARKISAKTAVGLLKIWLETPFEGGRHEGRVKKIEI